jgi:uncharacterized protein with HEPN domain
MSKRNAGVLLEDIRDAMRKVSNYVEGMSLAAFMADEKTVDAVVRNISVIGEATKQLPENFKDSHPDIPWAQMAGMRNRIVHDYAGWTWKSCGG